VLLNLVTNAQEVLPAGGGARLIAIVGSSAEGRATVEVQDTGPGIPEEAMPLIFQPFYTTKPQGTGLGLAISADIVRDCGGQLSARNRAEGGAAFRMTLPIAAATGFAAGGPPAPVPPKDAGAVLRSP
jgi:C4-dicarboxylate-specific signal transduction histidine kinase